jgi:hypothetical protein
MRRLNNLKLTPAAVLGLTVLLVSGCGGGSSSSAEDSSSASVVSRGIITGFGSVYVNEVRYHTKGTKFRIDDDNGNESELKVGMIVTVKGSSQGDGEGHADSIVYDNELKGPVSAIDNSDPTRKILTILGQAVLVTADTTIDDDNGLTFDNIAVSDVLEVSAYVTDTGFTATHIEKQDNASKIEIKGHIKNLTPNSFTIGGFAVSYIDGTTKLDDISALAEDLFVEVKGQLDVAGTTLIASKIEGEDEGFEDDVDEAEIKGIISAYNIADDTFMLQGQKVDASDAKLEPASLVLANGVTVEVEGYVSGVVLIADEVEQKGHKIKIQATLSAVDTLAGTVSFNFNATDVTVRVNAGTEIEDDNTGNDLLLADLSVGNFVEMEGYAESLGVINAVEIKRFVDPDEIRIVAPLEGFDEIAMSVDLLGIEFDLTAAGFEDGNNNSLLASEFFDALVVGDFIKIKDDDSNAVFDKAELDD